MALIITAPETRIALMIVLFAVFAASVYISSDVIINREDISNHIGFAIHTMLSGILLAVNAAANVPFIVNSILILALIVLLCLFRVKHREWQNKNLSLSSLKQAMDNLPIGLCFYTDSGQIALSNNIIQNLSHEIIGTDLRHPLQLLKEIENRNPYVTKDGKVYMFETTRLDDEMNQLAAFNITDTYNLMTELTEENRKLEEMNAHMRKYNMMVDQTVKKEEQLETRIRIHDDLGRILLSTKVYLKRDDDFISKEELLSKWNQTLTLLRGESLHNRNNNSMQVLQDAAAQVGIELEFVGDMPDDNRLLHFILSGGRECITNSAHAGASKLTVNISDEGNRLIVTYMDNGREPEYPITEGGGLSSLRQIVERDGVQMETATSGRYFLKLIIPKEV